MTTTNTTLTIDSTETTLSHDDRLVVSVHNSSAYVRCSLCAKGDYADRFGGRSHTKWCDLRGVHAHETVATPRPVAAPVQETRVAPSAAALVLAAKEGTLRSVATDDEIVEAVRNRVISMSDAMNRDY